jgi:putative phosphoribosyl transferase
MRFRDREDAGRRLADVVAGAGVGGDDTVVLGLPRGGVPVAGQVARALGAPLDVIVVRKLGVPSQPELAMGAIGEGGVRVANENVVQGPGRRLLDLARTGPADKAGQAEQAEQAEQADLAVRAARYRGGRPRLDLSGRCAVIVDDGVATGSSARAACQVARAQRARRVVLAVPVASAGAVAALRDACDMLLCVTVPDPFYAVGEWYRDFSQTTDEEVVRLLREATAADS